MTGRKVKKMKKKEIVRMLLLFFSFIVFVPFAFFMYYGNTATYIKAYCDGQYNDFPLILLGVIIAGLGLSLIIQIALIFILPDGKAEKRNRLFRISISDSCSVMHVFAFLLSIQFILLLRSGRASLLPMTATYIILFICELLIIFLPGQKEIKTSSNNSEIGSESNALDGFIEYLDKLSKKSESPAMSDAIDALVKLIEQIDPTLSHGMQALDTELSAKCVSIEEAISKNDGTAITILTRELYDTTKRLEDKIEAAIITLKGDDFSKKSDEIAEGLIDEILDAYDIEDEADIVKIGAPLFDDLRFIKAKRFAASGYKAILDGYETAINDEIRQKNEAARVKNQKFERIFSKVIYVGYAMIAVCLAVSAITTAYARPGGFSYAENEDGTLAITGYNPLYGGHVEIPSTIRGKEVTSIATNAIRADGRVSEIVIPNGVKRIEYEALRNLYDLTAIYLPESIEYIGNYAFAKNEKMTVYYAGSKDDFTKIEIGLNGNGILYEGGVSGEGAILSDDVIKYSK